MVPFFNPKSIAVIGASRDPHKPGHVIFRNLLEGFKGKVYPVNPNAEEILGKPCYPFISKLPEKPDLAVIAIPAPLVPGVLDEVGKAGIKAAIIISAGFSEIGNLQLEKRLVKTAKKHGIRILGPNCLGIYDPYTGLDTFFLPRYKLERPKAGNIAFISQSGALGSVMLDWMAMKGYRISRFISYGNAADIDEADLLEFLEKDRKTRVICAYFEGVREGRRFYQIAKRVSRKKPIIALKAGNTEAGGRATLSHTGSLAGSPHVYQAAFRQAGIIQAGGLEEMFDFARTLATQPKPRGPRVLIITNGGGFGVLATDAVVQAGLKLSRLSHPEKLKKQFPPHVVISNPMDLTGDADAERYRKALQVALKDPQVDMILLISLFQIPTLTAEIVDVIQEFSGRKPLVVVAAGGRYTEALKKPLEDSGIPCFSYPERAAKALSVLWKGK